MIDEADQEAWNELAGTPSSSDAEEDADDNIGRVHVVGDTFIYQPLLGTCPQVSIQHQPEKGLSFQIWPSSLSIARYAEEQHRLHSNIWQDKRIIELGCGCGLVGLIFAALGAQVLLTDLPQTMELVATNIALNKDALAAKRGSAAALPLVWGETDCRALPAEWQHPDLVLAADVVYHRELFGPLLATLKELGGASTEIILGHVRRWKSDKHFFSQARKHFLVADITSQAGNADDEGNAASHTRGALRIYRLTKTR